jgi:hypothetical protein
MIKNPFIMFKCCPDYGHREQESGFKLTILGCSQLVHVVQKK